MADDNFSYDENEEIIESESPVYPDYAIELEEIRELCTKNAIALETLFKKVDKLSSDDRKIFGRALDALNSSIKQEIRESNEETEKVGIKVYQNVKGYLNAELPGYFFSEQQTISGDVMRQNSMTVNNIMAMLAKQQREIEALGARIDKASIGTNINMSDAEGLPSGTLIIIILCIANLVITILHSLGVL